MQTRFWIICVPKNDNPLELKVVPPGPRGDVQYPRIELYFKKEHAESSARDAEFADFIAVQVEVTPHAKE